jgi:hypothetical protein
VPATCSSTEGDPDPVASSAELQNKIVGTWRLCSGTRIAAALGALADDIVGIEFDGTGAFWFVTSTAGGATPVRATDASARGTYCVGSDNALNLTGADRAHGWVLQPSLSKDPTGGVRQRRMRVRHGSQLAVYVFLNP